MDDDVKEFCKNQKQILDTLLKLINKEGFRWTEAQDYLESAFDENLEKFCGFIGYLEAEFGHKPPSRKTLLKIFPVLAMFGKTSGYSRGYHDAKRAYWPPYK